MIARLVSAVFALVAVLAGAGTPARAPARAAAHRPAVADTFPHARHAKLFTTCDACHAGIASGDTATMLPPPELCAGCHNGDMARQVNWQPHPFRATNLQLDHAPHVAMFQGMEGGAETACQRCHARADSLPFMDVGRADPARCLGCHGEGAPSHLAQTQCLPCHVSLHEAKGLTAADIAGFPKPPSHDSTWVLSHKQAAQGGTCAVCHAQNFCASCHVNAASVSAIDSLAVDQRVASLVRGVRRTYPRPPSHLARDWDQGHGAAARASVAECANCHAQESCYGCHRLEERVPPARLLPSRASGAAYGVDLAGLRPADHLPDQLLRHRVTAAAGDVTCNRCHTQRYCASCHDAAKAPGFHGADFVQRHAQQAFAREEECASCHNTQVFCRDCHRALGRADTRSPTAKFHDAQPGWLFGHGGIARRSIETCASCHAQNFCLTCHSATTGWQINPHGSHFSPSVSSKNKAMCMICHTTGIPTH
ncbi:MAG TPA: cytochrome c3 family protein [Gemmatimonadales bacterium]|nr:cytochrome c3 family protein [Gemmatimonadales bacterium]